MLKTKGLKLLLACPRNGRFTDARISIFSRQPGGGSRDAGLQVSHSLPLHDRTRAAKAGENSLACPPLDAASGASDRLSAVSMVTRQGKTSPQGELPFEGVTDLAGAASRVTLRNGIRRPMPPAGEISSTEQVHTRGLLKCPRCGGDLSEVHSLIFFVFWRCDECWLAWRFTQGRLVLGRERRFEQ